MKLYIQEGDTGPRLYLANISKGGEGSRGGKVIGHTKSGKAIYEANSNLGKRYNADAADQANDEIKAGKKAHLDQHQGYSQQDHKDAATAQRGESTKWHQMARSGDPDNVFSNSSGEMHRQRGRAAKLAASAHDDAAENMPSNPDLDPSLKSLPLYLKANPHRDPSVGTYIAGGGGAAKGKGQTDLSSVFEDLEKK